MTTNQPESQDCSSRGSRRHKRQERRGSTPKITRNCPPRAVERDCPDKWSVRPLMRRCLRSAVDELVRASVKATLSGVGVLALYWWHQQN